VAAAFAEVDVAVVIFSRSDAVIVIFKKKKDHNCRCLAVTGTTLLK
jgi:hypothetical protein